LITVMDGVPEGGGGGGGGGGGDPATLKVAVTSLDMLIVTVHVAVPLQAPLHPANIDPLFGAALSVTTVPIGKLLKQDAEQFRPGGELVTFPVPVPTMDNMRSWLGSGVPLLNVAVATSAELTVRVQSEVPEHAPLHPAKVDPGFGVAMRVSTLP